MKSTPMPQSLRDIQRDIDTAPRYEYGEAPVDMAIMHNLSRQRIHQILKEQGIKLQDKRCPRDDQS